MSPVPLGVQRWPTISVEEDPRTAELGKVFSRIDKNRDGAISKLDLIHAMTNDKEAAALVLPGLQGGSLEDEDRFEAAEAAFEIMGCGRSHVALTDFVAYMSRPPSPVRPQAEDEEDLRAKFLIIDKAGSGTVSKLELLAALQDSASLCELLVPGVDCKSVMDDEVSFDAVCGVFQAMAGGKRRADFRDFASYLRRARGPSGAPPLSRTRSEVQSLRESTRVFVIGPGQNKGLERAGYQVHFCGAPNPDTSAIFATNFLPQIKAELDVFKPDVMVTFSSAGAFVPLLWQTGYWRGPVVLLNAHPSCKTLPKDVTVVVAHGSNDERYPQTRESLEQLMLTGGANNTFLLYTANSGRQTTGHYSRVGDRHSLDSLQQHDCLSRLVDAAVDGEGPEKHFMRTCRERLQEARLEAEGRIGYTPAALKRSWASPSQRGMEHQKLFDVPPGSEEFQLVATVFKAPPNEKAIYRLKPEHVWDTTQVVRVQRVENGLQEEGSVTPYLKSLQRSFEGQGMRFEPGTHTAWGFHGASLEAIDSIVNDPVTGFQPLASGIKKASLWGSGTYFARDARYVAEGGFCDAPAVDGTQKMLMCLLMVGVPCLGNPEHHGVLPFRKKPHRYNSTVDSLASPEVYVLQHPGGAYPAYIVTFKTPPAAISI